MVIGSIVISRVSKIKRALRQNKNAYLNRELSDLDAKVYVQLFQVYQCRFLGLCFYRTNNNDSKAWYKLMNDQI